MPRLSDMIRSGQSALEHGQQPPREEPAKQQQESPQDAPEEQSEASFRSIPEIQEPPPGKMRDFPILTQLHNEVGTVATVVDQISRISDFIQAFTGGEGVTLTRPPAQPASGEPAAAPPMQDATQPQPAAPPPPAAPTPPPPPPEPEKPAAISEEEIEGFYDQLSSFVATFMKAAAAGQPISVDPAFVPIARAVDTPGALDVLYRRAIYARETGEGQDFGSAVELHSVNVAIYALKIGEGLRYNRDQLIDLGVAALVHDVGMVTLPPDFFSKGELSKQDIEILHQHPQKAHDILIQLGENYKWLAEVALEEHEREDGSGYPNGLSGSQIHEYARIIGVADMYAGLTRSRQDRRGRLPFEAVKEILQSQKTKFDTRIVRILLSKLSAFPIGSLVRLNSGAIGQVTETDETNQLRPVIRIIQDAHGRRVDDERIINLREFPILHITDVIYEEDLEQHR